MVAGLPKGFVRGIIVGGVAAVLWKVLAERRNRVALGGRLLATVEGVPYLGSRVYDLVAGPLLAGVYRSIAEEVTSEARSGEMMELGSGPGYLVVALGQRARDLQITTMDPSPHFVQMTEARVHGAGLGRQAKVATGSAEDAPYPEESFDFVVSMGGLRRWRDPGRVLAEVHRLLRPGGRAWIYDWRREMPLEGWEMVRRGLPAPEGLVFDVVVISPMGAAPTEDLLRELVAGSPFQQSGIGPLTVDIAGMRVPAVTRLALWR